MTRFFFNFRQGKHFTVDEVGCEFQDVETAFLGAVSAAQEMWSDLLVRREDPLICAFDVVDEHGNELFSLPFSEVLDACRGRKTRIAPPETPVTEEDKAAHAAREAARAAREAARAVREAGRSHVRTRQSLSDLKAVISHARHALSDSMSLLNMLRNMTEE